MRKVIRVTIRYSQKTLEEEREKFKKEYEEFCNNREKENSLTEWREREEWSTNKDQWM